MQSGRSLGTPAGKATDWHCHACKVPKCTPKEQALIKRITDAASRSTERKKKKKKEQSGGHKEPQTLREILESFASNDGFWEAADDGNPAFFTGAAGRGVNLVSWGAVLDIFDGVYSRFLHSRTAQANIIVPFAIKMSARDKGQRSGGGGGGDGDGGDSGDDDGDRRLLLACLRFSAVIVSLAVDDQRLRFKSIPAMTSLLSSTDTHIADAALQVTTCEDACLFAK